MALSTKSTAQNVYLLRNGLIATFDAAGQQIPECQGRADDENVWANLAIARTPATRFHLGTRGITAWEGFRVHAPQIAREALED